MKNWISTLFALMIGPVDKSRKLGEKNQSPAQLNRIFSL